MDGISTFKIAVKRLSESTLFAVAAAGIELDDIDLFVYHQANSRILKAVGERLDLEPGKVADYIAQLGNTSAASIPLTLSLSREDGRLRPGHKVLVAAIGAGFTWGAGVMEWAGSEPTDPRAPPRWSPARRRASARRSRSALAADGWVSRVNYRSDEAAQRPRRRRSRRPAAGRGLPCRRLHGDTQSLLKADRGRARDPRSRR